MVLQHNAVLETLRFLRKLPR